MDDDDPLAKFDGQGLQSEPMGARLRAAREAVGLSAADVAFALRIPADELEAGEAGTGPVMFRVLAGLAELYCIDLHTVVTGMNKEEWESHGPRTRLQ
jgi:transcriptional regulator with XRE-family HTH domain